MNLLLSRDTAVSALREYRARLRAELASEIPLNPDRDWTYDSLVEDEDEPIGDTLRVFRPA